ncbi:hypothetical protein HY797_01705 [Candidatus Falkowbacteria bacterium]|nr:hypothetical protein [Candidatus Falkowbacteria bacterium]
MTPKKAIIIIFILFLILASIFYILYINKKQTNNSSEGLNVNSTGQIGEIERGKPAELKETTEEKVNKIIEDAKNDLNANPDIVKQKIISTINAEIISQEENKTPEQKAADLKAQEEKQKIIDQINEQIKN